MNTNIKLTDTQRQVLEHAADHPEGLVVWFPDGVKGGARQKVLQGLLNRALITGTGDTFTLASAAYDAVGRAPLAPSTPHPEATPISGDTASLAGHTPELFEFLQSAVSVIAETKPRTRENSKQATVIQMLRRPEGATIHQICAITGWRQHTVRGTFAGAFKRKLGLTLTSSKTEQGERVYRVG